MSPEARRWQPHQPPFAWALASGDPSLKQQPERCGAPLPVMPGIDAARPAVLEHQNIWIFGFSKRHVRFTVGISPLSSTLPDEMITCAGPFSPLHFLEHHAAVIRPRKGPSTPCAAPAH